MLTLDKELADESNNDLTMTVDNLKEELDICKQELDLAKQELQEGRESFIAALPTDEAGTARVVEQNRELANALRIVRDR